MPPVFNILNKVVKGASTGVGLVGEKYHDHKERKAALAASENKSNWPAGASSEGSVNPMVAGAETANDEHIWRLDEAAGEPPSYAESQSHQRPVPERTVTDLVHNIFGTAAPRQDRSTRLPYPIIIPQRRPGARLRGFARAYPPDIAAFGIDEAAFLRFLQSFEDASQASGWLQALYISSSIVGFVPSTLAMAVSISLSVPSGIGIKLQTKHKANAFLDQVNREVFMPMGLYCMVLLCKDGPSAADDPEIGVEDVNLETAKQISKWGLPTSNEDDANVSTVTKIRKSTRTTSGKTNVNEMPLEIAPLTYPGLDDMMQRPNITRDESFKARIMRNKDFVGEYLDKRARAEYAGNNPDSVLTQSADNPEFHTRFADPNHACNNGHLVSLVTGGKVVARPRGRRNQNELREVGEDGRLMPKAKVPEPKIRGPVGFVSQGVKKVFTPNILYLTIVNLPSEDELRAARAAMGI